MMACSFGHAGIVRSLVEVHEKHIDINAVNLQGETCLMLCCYYGYFDALKVIVGVFFDKIDVNLLDDVRVTTFAREVCIFIWIP